MGGLLNILVPILAVFLVYKLYTTLGKNGDDDQNGQNNPFNPTGKNPIGKKTMGKSSPDQASNSDRNGSNVIPLPTAKTPPKAANQDQADPIEILANAMDTDNFANADNIAKDGLKKIIMAFPEFDYREFMNGAEVAYEMINLGFAENDREILDRLLTKPVYDSFNGVLDAREAAGHRVVSRFVGYERVQMKDAALDGNIVRLSVHFVAKLISTTYDKTDHIIDGDEKHIYNSNDVWTFEKDMKSQKTSWQLSATAKGA